MALIKCEECKKTFSDTLDACPHCGFKLKKEDNNNINSYINMLEDAYDYAKDTGLLDFPMYKKGVYATKESYLNYADNAYSNSFLYVIALVLNTIGEKKEDNYDGLKLLIPFYDEYYKGNFCIGICNDRIIYFHTKKLGIKIVEQLRKTLDVTMTNFSNVELSISPDKFGNIVFGSLLLDGSFKYKIVGYDPIMLFYLSYCVNKINNNKSLNYTKGEVKEKIFSEEQTKNAPSGGCYIATCVYGTYNCPEVWVLRRYRDNKLAKTSIGKCFIKCYYAISPLIVKLFGRTKWFKNIWKKKLDNMVIKLQKQGYDSTPYNDKKW